MPLSLKAGFTFLVLVRVQEAGAPLCGSFAHSSHSEMRLHKRDDGLGCKRLGHVSVRTGQSPLDAVKHPIAPREYHQHRPLKCRFGFEESDEVIAIQLRQAKIDQDERGDACFRFGELAERLYAVREALDLVACPTQAGFQNLAHGQ